MATLQGFVQAAALQLPREGYVPPPQGVPVLRVKITTVWFSPTQVYGALAVEPHCATP